MNRVNKFFVGALGGAIDSTLSSFPGSAIVWGAIKGGVNTIRTERAKNFILFIEKSFTLEMFQNEQFIDGLAISFQEFMSQRHKQKREIIKNIFNGFVNGGADENFELERMFDVLNKITLSQIKLLREFINKGEITLLKWGYEKEKNFLHPDYHEIKGLVYLGLLKVEIQNDTTQIPNYEGDEEDGLHAAGEITKILTDEYAKLSDFGREFINYIYDPKVD